MSRVIDDLSLVKACRAGHTEAFGTLVRRHQDRLFPTILRLIGSAEDAEDVLQDAFVRAFEKLDQFHGESSFYTWIYRIAVNLALSKHRQRRIRLSHRPHAANVAAAGEELPDSSLDADPTLPLERAERERVVEGCLPVWVRSIGPW